MLNSNYRELEKFLSKVFEKVAFSLVYNNQCLIVYGFQYGVVSSYIPLVSSQFNLPLFSCAYKLAAIFGQYLLFVHSLTCPSFLVHINWQPYLDNTSC